MDNESPQALLQSSGTGVAHPGVVPAQGGAAPQVLQLILAAQPDVVVIKSEVKTNVRHPVDEVIMPGDVIPVYVPIHGDAAVGPS